MAGHQADVEALASRLRLVCGHCGLRPHRGVGLGWIVHRTSSCDAVDAIERGGGKGFYDWQWKDGQVVPNGKPPWPKFLMDASVPTTWDPVKQVAYATLRMQTRE